MTHDDQQKPSETVDEHDPIYQHPLFIEVRNAASDLGYAHEVAMAGLRTLWECTRDPGTKDLAIRLYNRIHAHAEGRHD